MDVIGCVIKHVTKLLASRARAYGQVQEVKITFRSQRKNFRALDCDHDEHNISRDTPSVDMDVMLCVGFAR